MCCFKLSGSNSNSDTDLFSTNNDHIPSSSLNFRFNNPFVHFYFYFHESKRGKPVGAKQENSLRWKGVNQLHGSANVTMLTTGKKSVGKDLGLRIKEICHIPLI